MNYAGSGTKCEENCVIGIVSAFDWVRYGLKPHPAAIIHLLTQNANYNPFRDVLKRISKPVRIAVAGDSFTDLKLGYNLETALNNGSYRSKVRVDKILVNRYRNSSALEDINISNVRDMAKLIKSECYKVFICDGDNTLWKYYITKNVNVKDHSLFEKYGKMFPVKMSYTLFTITDMFWSFLKVHNRKQFCRSEGCIEDVVSAAKEAGSMLIINSMSNPIDMLKVLGKSNSIEKKYYYNNFFLK